MWTASKLSRFCAHHHLLSDLNPRPTRDAAAKKGRAFDAALQAWYERGIVPTMPEDDDVTSWLATMVEHGWAWPDGCELQHAWGMSKWGTYVAVEETAPASHVYRALDGEDLLTAGRLDIDWMADDLLVVIDWKSGRSLVPPARVNLQVNAAGIANAQRWKARGYVPGIYYAREGRWDMGDPVEMGSDDWEARFEDIRQAASLDDQPHPGDHCGDCFERKNCSAA